MNSISVNLHGYCSKLVNLHNYTLIDVGHFYEKLCKIYTFFYYIPTDVSDLMMHKVFLSPYIISDSASVYQVFVACKIICFSLLLLSFYQIHFIDA